jgi:hypothetical protein
MLRVYENIKKNYLLCGHKILTESVFLTQLPTKVGIPV